MESYHVTFYYKDYPAFNGLFGVLADSRGQAVRMVGEMIESKDEKIPGNWDRWVITKSIII